MYWQHESSSKHFAQVGICNIAEQFVEQFRAIYHAIMTYVQYNFVNNFDQFLLYFMNQIVHKMFWNIAQYCWQF